MSTVLPAIKPDVMMSAPELKIDNFNHLLKVAEQIEHEFTGFKGSHHDVYQARRRLNKLNRNLNSLRLKYRRSYEKPYQQFKAEVDELRGHIGKASDSLSKQLNKDSELRKLELKNRLKSTVHKLCSARSIPDFDVPDDCLKLSLSRDRRLKTLAHDADIQAASDKRERSKAVGDKMIDPITGEIEGSAVDKPLHFHDSRKKYQLLVKFIQDNHINVSGI